MHCGDPTPVARSLWPALDGITQREVMCEKTPNVCRQLGVAVPAPKTIVVVWSSYMDFSGHGFKGSGRFYARDGAGWSSIDCSVSFVSDPQAGPQPKSETCDARTPVPEAVWPTIEAIAPKPGYEENDVVCSKAPDVCATLGVPNKPLGA